MGPQKAATCVPDMTETQVRMASLLNDLVDVAPSNETENEQLIYDRLRSTHRRSNQKRLGGARERRTRH